MVAPLATLHGWRLSHTTEDNGDMRLRVRIGPMKIFTFRKNDRIISLQIISFNSWQPLCLEVVLLESLEAGGEWLI